MPFTIVYVGAGNTGRSVLAAADTVRELHRIWPRSADEVRVLSAGLDVVPGMPIAPHLETVAARRGLEVGDHTAATFGRETAESADLVLAMSRRQRAAVVLRFPQLKPRTFTLLEFRALLADAGTVRRRSPIGRGERLDAKLRLVTSATAARRRVVQPPADEAQWDLFDPYAYSLDVYERVAELVDTATRDVVAGVATITGGRAASASRTA